uniref:Putative ovule protein n=1 Tax=Solanum chacoense TaxID=4108 RepID=A0A0V0I7Z9_SOLCH
MNKAFNFILVLHKSIFHFLNRYHMHISSLFGVHCCQYWFFVQILGLYYFVSFPKVVNMHIVILSLSVKSRQIHTSML